MKIYLHGNNDYYLTKEQILKGYDGDVSEKIQVTIYNINKMVYKEWLFNLITHGCKILTENKSKIFDFEFKRISDGFYSGEFKENFYIKIKNNDSFDFNGNEFKIVPRHSDYGIDKDGNVLDIQNSVIKKFKPTTSGYPTRRIITYPVFSFNNSNINQNIQVHRLVAYAWCVNYDPLNKTVVNHRDGNTNNPNESNLEWTTHKENLQHAYETGLNTKLGEGDRLRSTLRNVDTGEIIKLTSKLRLIEKLNRYVEPPFGWKLPLGAIINGYEIRVYGDGRDWVTDKRFLFKLNHRVKSGKTYTIQVKGKEIVTFASGEEVCDYLKLPYTYPKKKDPKPFLLWIARKRKDVVIGAYRNEIISSSVRNPLAVKKNKSTITYDSIWYMIEDLNITIEEAYKLLETEYTWFCNKRLKKEITGVACSYLDVPKELIDRKRKISVRIKAPRADKVYEFDNLRDSFKFASKSGKDRSEKVLRGYPIGMLHCGYEYRLKGDDRPWMDEVNVWNFAKGSKCNYKVTFSDGTFMIYGNINTLVEIFDLKRARPEGQINEFKQNHPDKKLEVLEK